jgi:hypothetical protein
MRTIAFGAGALLLAFLIVGCGKSDEGEQAASAPPKMPNPITAEEATRGRQACETYVDQVCECALKVEDLTSECELARTRPGALDLNLRAAAAEGSANLRDRVAIQANARAIARACIQDAAALVKRGCEISAETAAPSGSAPAGSAKVQSGAPEPAPDRSR